MDNYETISDDEITETYRNRLGVLERDHFAKSAELAEMEAISSHVTYPPDTKQLTDDMAACRRAIGYTSVRIAAVKLALSERETAAQNT